MKNRIFVLCVFCAMLFFLGCENESPVAPDFETHNESLNKKVPVGTVTPIASLPAGDSPEGIAIDKQGNMYVSNRRDAGSTRESEILRISKSGDVSVYATLPSGPFGSYGVVGLVTDSRGNLYCAFASGDPATNGVYKIKRNGTPKRLKGSEGMVTPNSLTFDAKGNLYVTDSDGASVWKYGKKGPFSKWFEHPLLAGGIAPGGPPFPLPGANGIVFYPPNKLYVANTMQNSVSCIKIGRKGKTASIELVKQDFLLLNIDGIAVDEHENIYGAMPASTLTALGVPPLPPIVMLNTKSGVITPITMDSGEFDTPTSLAFGTGKPWNRKSVFVANAALNYGQSHDPWAGPGIVEVYVGTKGKKGK